MSSNGYGRAAWIVWGVGLFTYAVVVMHRTSLGVAGLEAAQHFGTTPGVISTFVVLQLATYAIAQVPIGLLLDRFGSRAMLTAGALLAGGGQVMLALADDLPLAYGARLLLGIGDACIFNSVLRLLPRWFEARRVPILSQITGMFAALGQIAAVAVVLPLIQNLGWTRGLLIASSTCLVAALAAALLVRNAPPGEPAAVVADPLREIPRNIAEVARHPATQLGFWIHFTSGFSMNAFVFMWGMPYLIVGQGLTQFEAAGLFTLLSVASMLAGPVVGALTARHPLRRSNLALIVICSLIAVWALVLLWPGKAPAPLLFLLVIVLAVNGPGTGIGFDFPRTSLPVTRLGAANGVVIAGGFTGGTLLILVMGIVLDRISAGGQYTADDLRIAWSLQAPFFAIGLAGILLSRRHLRAQMAERGVVVPTWREVAERIRASRRR